MLKTRVAEKGLYVMVSERRIASGLVDIFKRRTMRYFVNFCQITLRSRRIAALERHVRLAGP